MPYGWVAAAVALSGAMGASASKDAASTQAGAARNAAGLTMDMFNTQQANLAPWTASGGVANSMLLEGLGGTQSDWKTQLKAAYAQSFSGHPGMDPKIITALNDIIDKSSSPTDTSAYGESPIDFARRTGIPNPGNLASILSTAGKPAAPAGPNTGLFTRMPTAADIQIDPSFDFITKTQEDALMNQRSSLGGVNSGNTMRALTDYATGAASTEYGNAYGRWNQMINQIFSRLSSVSGTGANAAGGVAGLGMDAAAGAGAGLMGAANATAAGRIGSTNALTGAGQGIANNYLMYSMMNQNKGVQAQPVDWNSTGSFDSGTQVA